MGFNIAIDGPAGAGKSTIAKLAASELSYIYVDTGAMYRAIGLYVYRKHVPEEDTNAIGETAKETEVSIRYIDGERHVYLNGEDVSEEIRKEHIGHMAGAGSAQGLTLKELEFMIREAGFTPVRRNAIFNTVQTEEARA